NDVIERLKGGDGVVDALLDHPMGNQDDRYQPILDFRFLLHDRLDVDATLGEDSGDLSQYAWVVLGLDTQVVGRFAGADRQYRVSRKGVGLECQVQNTVVRIGGQGTRHVDQVSHHRRSSRLHAGTGTVVKRRAYRIAVDHYRIHHAIDVGDQTVGWDQRWMHTQLDTSLGTT